MLFKICGFKQDKLIYLQFSWNLLWALAYWSRGMKFTFSSTGTDKIDQYDITEAASFFNW
jgi:hypothetical protein